MTRRNYGWNLKGPLKPGVYELPVYHDDDCPRLHGGSCTCHPDVGEPILIPKDATDWPSKSINSDADD